MWRPTLLFLALLLAISSWARDKQENWLEVRSQHFSIITNSNEKTGRHIADQFERMRTVFHLAFPNVPIDRVGPIVVLAVKDESDFRALEPQVYLEKGQAKLAGLFLRAPDKNYVLMRINAEGEHPYAVIYHEYTHLLMGKAGEWIPLWFNEGLAEFYQNTDIHENDVALGEPSRENLELLRENRLLPLQVLFAVDANSPYYHQENKTSIFYAESWALIHYLQVNDIQQKTQRLTDYLQLVAQYVDPVTAAARAFGDLKQLQADLETYVHHGEYKYFKMAAVTAVDNSAFKVQPITPSQADAVRADFLAYDQRTDDAHALLDRIFKEDPNNVLAHETMGYLAFRAGHPEEALKWYEQAVKLDSQSYLAHYYFAAISMNLDPSANNPQIEASLRTAIKLDSSFAPAYERLAALLGYRRTNLEDAHSMALAASQMDPGNLGYRVTLANVLMQMDRYKDALAVLSSAQKLAKSPQEAEMLQSTFARAEAYASAREQQNQNHTRAEAEWNRAQANGALVAQARAVPPVDEKPPTGSHHIVLGKLLNVQCHDPSIDLTFAAKGRTVALHNPNYFKIQFSALGFTPKGDLNPCHDLEGATANVDYVDLPEKPGTAYVFAIEIHR
jgi:tetratricopeptide (TPR) repeat protein